MKSKITSYLFAFLFLVLTASLISITSIILENFIKNEKTQEIIISILSLLLFLITAIIFGRKIKSKGLINGIIFALLYFACVIGKNDGSFLSITLTSAKMLTLIIGTMMGVNLEN